MGAGTGDVDGRAAVVSSDCVGEGEAVAVVVLIGSRFCVRNMEPRAFVDWVVRSAFRAAKNCSLVLGLSVLPS